LGGWNPQISPIGAERINNPTALIHRETTQKVVGRAVCRRSTIGRRLDPSRERGKAKRPTMHTHPPMNGQNASPFGAAQRPSRILHPASHPTTPDPNFPFAAPSAFLIFNFAFLIGGPTIILNSPDCTWGRELWQKWNQNWQRQRQ
jgi:hypothetical protein